MNGLSNTLLTSGDSAGEIFLLSDKRYVGVEWRFSINEQNEKRTDESELRTLTAWRF